MSDAGLETIRDMISRLRRLKGLAKEVAPTVAREMALWAHGNVRAGVGPDGAAWPTRQDGSPSHVGTAVEDTTAASSGTIATLTVSGPTVFRHFGAQGRERRGVLPGNIPFKLGNAIRLGVVTVWSGIMKGGR